MKTVVHGLLIAVLAASPGCSPSGAPQDASMGSDAASTSSLDGTTSDDPTDAADEVVSDAGVVSDDATDDGADPAVPASTWTYIYTYLLHDMSYASNCTGEGCHDPGIELGFDLSTPANGYRTVQTKLSPGDPGSSTIVRKLEAGDMPRGRPMMPSHDIALIKAWIAAGAVDD
jgi:hypothetical protein